MTLSRRFFALMLTLAFVALIPLGASHAQSDTRTYITQSGLYAFNYPAEWVVRERSTDTLEIGTSIRALDLSSSSDPLLSSGDVISTLIIYSAKNTPGQIDISGGSELLVASFLKNLGTDWTLQKAESITFKDRVGSRVGFTFKALRGAVYGFFVDSQPIVAAVAFPASDSASPLSRFEAILSSFAPVGSVNTLDVTSTPTFRPTATRVAPRATATAIAPTGERFTSPGGVFSVGIPQGWVARNQSETYSDFFVYLATSEDLIDNFLTYSEWDYLYSGQYALYLVNYGPTSQLPANMPMTRNLDVLLGFALGSQTKYTWETPIRDKVAGYDVALALGKANYAGDVVQMAFYIGDTPYFLFGISAPGDRIALVFRMASVIKSIRPAS